MKNNSLLLVYLILMQKRRTQSEKNGKQLKIFEKKYPKKMKTAQNRGIALFSAVYKPH